MLFRKLDQILPKVQTVVPFFHETAHHKRANQIVAGRLFQIQGNSDLTDLQSVLRIADQFQNVNSPHQGSHRIAVRHIVSSIHP